MFRYVMGVIMFSFRLATHVAAVAIGLTSVAAAADLSFKAPAYNPPPTNDWTGFYVGANVGGGWGHRSVNASPNDPITILFFPPPISLAPPSSSFNSSGALGGLQLGYNWQVNHNWVVGLETDFDWSGMKGSGSSSGTAVGPGPVFFPFTNAVSEKVDWFGTVRARLGYLPTNNLLTYATGGFAYGRITDTGSDTFGVGITSGGAGPFGFTCAAATPCFSGSSSTTATGWTVGAGFEYLLMRNWTLKAEYLYVNLGSHAVTQTAAGFTAPATLASSFNANFSNTAFNIGRVGINYHF